MRKMFTKLFGLALLFCLLGSVTELSAQCNVAPLTGSSVELVTDPADVCDSAYITYQVVGYTNAEYAFNLDDDPSGWGGFTSDSTVAVKEGVPFSVVVRVNDTCLSNELYYTDVDLITPVVIQEPEVEHPQCYGDDGEVTIKFTGNHGPYTYYFVPEADWTGPMEYVDNSVGSAQIIAGEGKYYVAVQDVKGCVDLSSIAAWDSAVVNAMPPMLVVDTVYGSDPACIGGDGSVTVVVSGGYGGEYEVTVGGQTMTTVDDTAMFAVPAGSYTATAVDSNMCSVVSDSTVVLTDPAEITFDISIDDVTCADGATGVIYVHSFTGPVGASFSASLGDGTWVAAVDDTVALSGLVAGYYSVFVDNVNDVCDSVAYENPNVTGNVISVQSPGEIDYTVAIDTGVCYGDNSVITVQSLSGGSGNYEFSNDGGSTWGSASSWTVPTGTYNVVVRDADASSCELAYPEIVLVDPAQVVIDDIDVVSPTCPGGNDGAINVYAIDGVGTTQYSLDNETWYYNSIFAVYAGTYTVYVRDETCPDYVVQQVVTVAALDENVIEIDQVDDILCYGAGDGAIYIDIVTWAQQVDEDRGVEVYYSTSMDDITGSGTMMDDEEGFEATDLEAGTYYIQAIDVFGCMSNVLTAVITEEGMFTISGSVTDNASCYGSYDGEVTITAGNGTPVLYGHANTMQAAMALSEDAMTEWPDGSSAETIQVGKGTYYVVVIDECDAKVYAGPFTVDGFDMVTITDTAMSVTHNTCWDDVEGRIEVFPAAGGSGDLVYTLQIDNEGWEDVDGYVEVTTTLYTDLEGGDYRVVVTDTLGCEGAETGTITVNTPSEVEIDDYDYEQISCNGTGDGTIYIEAYGGTAPYQFKVGTTNWRDFPEGSDEKTIVVTEEGEYEVWIRDANGCESESMTFLIYEPEPIMLDVVANNVTDACDNDNGSLVISATGGESIDFSFFVNGVESPWHLSPGSEYTVSGLAAGEYVVRARENHTGYSCDVETTVMIYAPDTVTAVAEVTQAVTCNGGADGEIVVSDMTGGTVAGNYTVTLSPSGTGVVVDGTVVFSNLMAGTYSATVEDDQGCSYTINGIVVEEPTALTLNATHIADITCIEDGKFSIQVTGGTAGYVYYTAKSDPESGHILIEDIPTADGTTWLADSVLTVSEAGTWVVWAMDANGCIIGGEEDENGPVNAWRVQIEEPSIVVTVDATESDDPACNGDMTASITVNPADVVITMDGDVLVDPVYTVTINGVDTNMLENLGAGTYVVMVTHEDGCYGTDTVVFDQPDVLNVTLELGEGEFTCPDVVEGYIEATANGGTEDYEYQLWKDGAVKTDYQSENSFLVQINHSYVVVVMDEQGCTDTSNVITIDPVAPVELVGLMDVTCSSDTLASVKVTATAEGDRQVYVKWTQFEAETGIYSDSTGLVDQGEIVISQMFEFDNENLDDIHYVFQVMDEKGCVSGTDTITLDQVISSALEVTVSVGAVDCGTEVTITPAGGVAPYVVMVDDEAVTESMVILPGGMHTVTVTDAHECMVTEEFELGYSLERTDTIYYYDVDSSARFLGVDYVEGVYEITYTTREGCDARLTLSVIEVEATAPVVESLSPNDSIGTNHPVFTMVFVDDVTLTGTGNLTVTDDTGGVVIVIPMADAVLTNGNTVTVDYDATVLGYIPNNATLTVTVDSGAVMGDGLAWDGQTAEPWTFKTGPDWATDVDLDFVSDDFKVYPNPFHDYIKIDNYDKLSRVVVTNIAGQRVLDIEYPSNEIRTGNLVTGVYVVTLIKDSSIVKSERIIKR